LDVSLCPLRDEATVSTGVAELVSSSVNKKVGDDFFYGCRGIVGCWMSAVGCFRFWWNLLPYRVAGAAPLCLDLSPCHCLQVSKGVTFLMNTGDKDKDQDKDKGFGPRFRDFWTSNSQPTKTSEPS